MDNPATCRNRGFFPACLKRRQQRVGVTEQGLLALHNLLDPGCAPEAVVELEAAHENLASEQSVVLLIGVVIDLHEQRLELELQHERVLVEQAHCAALAGLLALVVLLEHVDLFRPQCAIQHRNALQLHAELEHPIAVDRGALATSTQGVFVHPCTQGELDDPAEALLGIGVDERLDFPTVEVSPAADPEAVAAHQLDLLIVCFLKQFDGQMLGAGAVDQQLRGQRRGLFGSKLPLGLRHLERVVGLLVGGTSGGGRRGLLGSHVRLMYRSRPLALSCQQSSVFLCSGLQSGYFGTLIGYKKELADQ